jgi:hypothetical protein
MKKVVLVLIAAVLLLGAGPIKREPTFLKEGPQGVRKEELTKQQKESLTPELDTVRVDISNAGSTKSAAELALKTAKEDLELAKISLQNAYKEFNRVQSSLSANYTASDLALVQNNLDAAKAAVEAAKTTVATRKSELSTSLNNLRSLKESYKTQLDSLLPTKAVDEYLEGNGWSTYKSVLQKVAANMGVTVNLDSDTEVESLLNGFKALSEEKNIKYGVWGTNTTQGRIKAKMKLGKVFKIAKLEVLMEDGYTLEEASDKVAIDALRESGLSKRAAIKKYLQQLYQSANPQTEAGKINTWKRLGQRMKNLKRKGGI